jgi:CDP-paratose 2-epimerase
MKYFINGGCGFLGSNLAREVLRRGEELFVFDNLSRLGAVDNLAWLQQQGTFRFIHGDIRSGYDIERAIKDICPDVLFHLSGQVAMTTSIANPKLDFEVNVVGAFNTLDAVRRHAPDCKVLFSSTNKVYGDLEWVEYNELDTRYVAKGYEKGFDESIPLDFRSPYGVSKGAADQYMLDFHRTFGVRTCVFRHSSMYGGRQFATYDQGWIGWFCQKALEIKKGILKEPFKISGSGKQVRDLLHARDMISLYFTAAERFDQADGRVFNIGGGMENSLSLLELFAMLESSLGMTMQYVRLPPRVSDQKVFVADVTKASGLLGWKPVVDNRTGIYEMIEWSETLVRMS